VLALDFPRTVTETGWVNAARDGYTPLAVLAHPGTYIIVSSLIGYLIYRRLGLWSAVPLGQVLVKWLRAIPMAVAPIFLLTVLASVLIDSGMTAVIALGLVATLGHWYPLLSPAVGATGSFITGSTTSSNALLSGLQADAAHLLDVPRPALVAAQTVGGNVGNSVAPVIVAVGASTADATHQVRAILLKTLPPALVLLAVVTAMVSINSLL
jgi:lactate permease